MEEEIRRSRERISRRRALGLGGTIGLGALVTACTGSSPSGGGAAPSLSASSTAPSDVLALLDEANTCVTAREETQGPYWFDVDSIRSDLREDRPGTPLLLAVRAHDLSQCMNGSAPAAIPNSVAEIWHCDAGGVYSGFESASQGGPGGGGPGGGGPGGDSPVATVRVATVRVATVGWRRSGWRRVRRDVGRLVQRGRRRGEPDRRRDIPAGAPRSPTGTASCSSRRSIRAGIAVGPCTFISSCTWTARPW